MIKSTPVHLAILTVCAFLKGACSETMIRTARPAKAEIMREPPFSRAFWIYANWGSGLENGS